MIAFIAPCHTQTPSEFSTDAWKRRYTHGNKAVARAYLVSRRIATTHVVIFIKATSLLHPALALEADGAMQIGTSGAAKKGVAILAG